MPSTNFVDGSTVIEPSWLNDVDLGVNVTLSGYLARISSVKNVRIPDITAPGWITDSRLVSIDWTKVINRPTTMAGYGISDRPTLLNVKLFTTAQSGMTYIPTPGTARIYIEMVGGGGSGGLAGPWSGYPTVVVSSGGSSGTWACGVFTSGITGHTITVGAGGVCTTSGSVAGGTTSLGTLLSCPGGAGGLAGITQSHPSGTDYTGPNPYPNTMTGDATGSYLLSVPGGPGDPPNWDARSGSGAKSQYGQGGMWYVSNTAPSEISAPITSYGSAGAGASSSGPSTYLGGNGAPGVIIIWEFNS